jgi:hypothetical protein
MKLSEHVVDFEKRSTIKSQILADFITDWTEQSSKTKCIVIDMPRQISCDGAYGISGAGAATILMSPSSIKLRYTARL